MTMTDSPDFEKQAQETVTACIKSNPLGGSARIVPVICQQIAHAARVNKAPKDAVIAACRGAANAVLLGGQSVPDAAIGIMDALPGMSLMMRSGPEDLMSWVMEGVADVMPMAGDEIRDALSARIEEKFMGASMIFNENCEAANKKPRD